MTTDDWVLLGVLGAAIVAGLVAIGVGAVGHEESRPDALRVAHFVLSGALLASSVTFTWYRARGRVGFATVGKRHGVISGALGVIVAALAFVAPNVLGVLSSLATFFL